MHIIRNKLSTESLALYSNAIFYSQNSKLKPLVSQLQSKAVGLLRCVYTHASTFLKNFATLVFNTIFLLIELSKI